MLALSVSGAVISPSKLGRTLEIGKRYHTVFLVLVHHEKVKQLIAFLLKDSDQSVFRRPSTSCQTFSTGLWVGQTPSFTTSRSYSSVEEPWV